MRLSLPIASGPIALVAGRTAVAGGASGTADLGNGPLHADTELESTRPVMNRIAWGPTHNEQRGGGGIRKPSLVPQRVTLP